MSKILILAGLTLLTLTTGLRGPLGMAAELAPSWPQWRGPLASGVAPTGDPPTTWSETQNVRWKVPIPGRGASTPIVWGDTIYLQTAIATGDLKPTQQNFTVDFQRTGESVYYGQAYVQSKHDQVFQVLAIDRQTGAKLGSFGRPGHMAGNFKWVHNMAIDSKGTIYTAEVGDGRRVQKFKRGN